MILDFIKHGWLRFVRSGAFSKQLATSIFIGFLVIMFGGYLLALAFFLNTIIVDGLQQADSLSFLNGILLYYFVFELMMRFFLQGSPVLDIQPYLHLPVKKTSMMHFLLGKSIIHLLNVTALILFGPFAFQVIAPEYGIGTAINWWLSIVAFSLVLHFVMLLFNKKFSDSPWSLAIILIISALAAGADYFGLLKLSTISTALFSLPLSSPLLLILIVAVVTSLYYLSYRFFLNNTYLEELQTKESSHNINSPGLSFLQSLGMVGELIGVEWRLILRHKRTRSALMLCGIFLLYGLLFYPNKMYREDMPAMLVFVGIFITGIFMINYGQFLFSWQAAHFDFTLTRPVTLRQYVLSKYWLMAGVSMACFILTIPYLYFGWKILLINSCMFLFNLGVNVHIIMNMSMWSPKKINLEKGSAFNYEGVGAAQWVMGLPILLSPYVVYLPLRFLGYELLGIIALGCLGLVGFIFRDKLIDLTTRRLLERKHQIASGFRNEG